MAFSLAMASIIVRGNFNPYIVSPEWLAQNEIWNEEEIQLAFGAVVDGIKFKSGDTEWLADNKSLQISSMNDCGSLAAQVLRTLPHTPVIAIGLNFEYLSLDPIEGLNPNLGSKFGEIADEDFEVTKWSGVIHQNESRVEMTVVTGSQGVSVTFNHHVANRNIEKLIDFAESFEERKASSESLIRQTLKETVNECPN